MEGRADQMISFCFFFGGEGRKDVRDRVQSKAEVRVEYPLQDGPPAVMSRDMTPRIRGEVISVTHLFWAITPSTTIVTGSTYRYTSICFPSLVDEKLS